MLFRDIPETLNFKTLFRNTQLADTKLHIIKATSIDDLVAKLADVPDDRLLGISIKNKMSNDEEDLLGKGYMVTVIKKGSLQNLLSKIKSDDPSPMDLLEKLNGASTNDLPLVSFVFGFQKEKDKAVLGIENRFIHPDYRKNGLMKQLSYNIIETLYQKYGDFIVLSQPVHAATIKFYSTEEHEKQSLKPSMFNEAGYIVTAETLDVTTAKPALILLRYHAKACRPQLAEHWNNEKSTLTDQYLDAIQKVKSNLR